MIQTLFLQMISYLQEVLELHLECTLPELHLRLIVLLCQTVYIHEIMVIDSGVNLSDHASLVIEMYIPVTLKPATCRTFKQSIKHFSFCWDHGDVLQSYMLTVK